VSKNKNILSTQSKSHSKLFVSLGAVHSAPVGSIVAADCCGRTPLVADSKAVFFIWICKTSIIAVFSNYGFMQKFFFECSMIKNLTLKRKIACIFLYFCLTHNCQSYKMNLSYLRLLVLGLTYDFFEIFNLSLCWSSLKVFNCNHLDKNVTYYYCRMIYIENLLTKHKPRDTYRLCVQHDVLSFTEILNIEFLDSSN
jgi:hypothetical protein